MKITPLFHSLPWGESKIPAPLLRRGFEGWVLFFVLFVSTSCHSCFAAVITSWQIATTQCNSPVLGAAALDPDDEPKMRAFQGTLHRAYVTMGLYYDHISTGDWSRADALMALNKGPRILIEFSNVTSNNVSNAVAAVIARYTNLVYAIAPQNEPSETIDGVTNYSRYFNQARGAINAAGFKGIIRIAAPSLSHSDITGFMFYLTNLVNGVTNIDLIDAHDYFAVPGNGIPATNNFYIHPVNTNGAGTTLAQRLADLNRWQSLTGHTNDRPVMSEYGLYSIDVQDAIDAARAFKTNNVALMFNAPGNPVNMSIPNGHQLPGPLWSKAMSEFLKEICR